MCFSKRNPASAERPPEAERPAPPPPAPQPIADPVRIGNVRTAEDDMLFGGATPDLRVRGARPAAPYATTKEEPTPRLKTRGSGRGPAITGML